MNRPGTFRHSIAVEEKSTATDDFGTRQETWAVVKTIRASINPVSGKEFFARSGEATETSHIVRTRFNPSLQITTANRLVRNGIAYDIVSVIVPDLRNRELIIMCNERSRI